MHLGRSKSRAHKLGLGVALAAILFVGAAQAQQPTPKPAEQPAASAQPSAQPGAQPDAQPSAQPDAQPSGSAAAADTPPDATVAQPEGGAPAPAPTTAAPGEVTDGATYAVRLRDLQQRIDQLKEQIRRSHTRLSLLSETIISGGASGSRATIRFENKLSSQFQLTRALIVLDGAVQYNKTDRSGVLADQKVIPVFSGSIPPGDHTVQVLVNLRGHGYGVFSYLRGYRFEVRSSHSFTAVEGKTTRLRILAYEKGGVTTPLEERPAVRYLEKVVAGLVDASGKPAGN
jgi:hypothetical protein